VGDWVGVWLDLARGVVVVVWAVSDLGNACQELLIVRTICHNSAEQKGA